MENKLIFHPIISSIQKIALYETKSKFYLVGSNNTQTRFRVLKIDRMEPRELIIHDDKVEYTKNEIHNLVSMIDSGNRQKSGSGFSNVISAFGIVGFIRFLEGYYIILVTKRRKAALIGYHTIYKIKCTSMIYIPHDSVRLLHPDEPRYYKMFQGIDLSSNFYFSYSYDLSHTLQHNMTSPKQIIPNFMSDHIPDFSTLFTDSMFTQLSSSSSVQEYGIRAKPHRKFVWNSHLLGRVEYELHPDWVLYVTHGFVGQSNICVFGRSVYVTLIARRSSKYAGTRFLKRGANFQGDVANEVETEQIIHDSGVSSLSSSHITSFVQMRGSIPGHWRQEMGKMVAKPAITIDLYDPFAETAGAHFNELLKRYGSPIIILNLVKQHEKKKQEKLLSDELSSSVKYLNQFLPAEHQLQYKTFDMARKNKSSTNVMGHLAGIAKSCAMKTGIYHNRNGYESQKENTILGPDTTNLQQQGTRQTGIIRTNCVDCLDRTNTAQFAIGKCVLGYQLCALGILDTPQVEFDTDCVRMLESLYEDHGDTLALQYGGSQLVHRVKTYRKTAPWTSQGNDIMQTLSRYYSNTFSDAEKQNSINLFLGLFTPEETKPPIWEFASDYYFHHKPQIWLLEKPLSQWWDTGIFECLPLAHNEVTKACSEIIQVHSKDVEMIDAYSDYHRPDELTILSDLFAYKLDNSIRDFMPNCTTNYSPFTIRVRPGKRREDTAKNSTLKNPSLTGQSSTSSTASSNSSSTDESDSSEDESIHTNESQSQMTQSRDSGYVPITFESLFPSMKQVYGTEIEQPLKPNMLLYKKYVLIGRKANGTSRNAFSYDALNLTHHSIFTKDTSINVETPDVSDNAKTVYENYVTAGIKGGRECSENDKALYKQYVASNR